MWNKKENKTVLGQGLIKGIKEAVEAEVVTKEEQKEALIKLTQDGELFELLEQSDALVEVLAKALQDATGFLPAGGSITNTVNKALAKYNESKK